ncbi:MAG TPA: DUF1735 domain-containing protein [Chitinophagaceae bacterium]
MKRLSFIASVFFLAGLLFVASCKKDTIFGDIAPNTDRPIAEFADGKTGGSVAMDFTTNEVEIDLTELRLFIRSKVEADKDVKVKFSPNSAIVADFNAANGTSFTSMPFANYTLVSNEATFTQADRSTDVKIKLRPSTLIGQNYAIGLKISEVTGGEASELAGSVVVAVAVKNAYDGVYELEFTNYHPASNPGYIGTTVEVYMVTTSATTCKIYFPDLGGFYCPAVLTGSLTAFGSQEPAYTFNPTTNAVTVQNSFSGATTFYSMAAGFNSRYVPATKEIFAKWGYNGTGGPYPPFDPATTREWTQHFTYVGPRP